ATSLPAGTPRSEAPPLRGEPRRNGGCQCGMARRIVGRDHLARARGRHDLLDQGRAPQRAPGSGTGDPVREMRPGLPDPGPAPRPPEDSPPSPRLTPTHRVIFL